MRNNPWLVLAVGVTAVAGVVAVLSHHGGQAGRGVSQAVPVAGVREPSPGVDRAREEARAGLVALARGSQARMPPGYEGVYIGMTVEQLRQARPAVVQGRGSAEGRSDVWEERAADGGRVVYLTAARLAVVTQVQFMARLPDAQGLMADFHTMQGRYGDPTGFWDCPETATASAIRRITWWGEAASVMEAILVYPGGVSVTRIVGATGDIGGALQRSRCQPVTRESLTQWPIATQLRGEQVPFVNPR